MTAIKNKPATPPPAPKPAATQPAASKPAANKPGAAAPRPPAAVVDQVEKAIREQDPAVIANLAAQQNNSLTGATTQTPARGLSNPAASTSSADAAAQAASKVDFSKMTQDQQYDYLQKLSQEKAGTPYNWKTGDKELNLIGVRSYSGGKANAGEADKYNDTIYACRMNNGKKEVYAFDGSVDAGKWNDPANTNMAVADRHGNTLGIAHMADGHYQDAFTRGAVSGSDLGLRQSGWVRAHVDKNNDGLISDNEKLGWNGKGRMAGADLQFQFHAGEGDTVGESSAGCQTIKAEQFGQFQKLLREAPESQKTFGYTLTDGKNLKSVEEQMAYKPPVGWAALGKTDPLNWWNSATANSGAQQWMGANIGSQGRGMVNSDDQNITVASRDAASDANVAGVQGNGGIGIVRTPYTSATSTPKFDLSSLFSSWKGFSW